MHIGEHIIPFLISKSFESLKYLTLLLKIPALIVAFREFAIQGPHRSHVLRKNVKA